ncbi:MAG: YoaK family protein [Chitinophagales bacterium]
MFKHRGRARTYSHNLKIASLLSVVAGIVNVVGFFSVQKLTTNVTGHFAFFVDEIIKLHFTQSIVYLLYVVFFFFGSFVSSLLIEITSKKNERYIFFVPASIEVLILTLIGIIGNTVAKNQPDIIAFSLLFSMGLQNSLVTSISNSVVRTTHLTGLFTDLGIELSQLFFYKESEQIKRLWLSIKLRLTIISSFFLGGIIAGLLYVKFEMFTLLLAVAILSTGLVYDNIKIRIVLLSNKLKNIK